jgi:hypothetical protein
MPSTPAERRKALALGSIVHIEHNRKNREDSYERERGCFGIRELSGSRICNGSPEQHQPDDQ